MLVGILVGNNHVLMWFDPLDWFLRKVSEIFNDFQYLKQTIMQNFCSIYSEKGSFII